MALLTERGFARMSMEAIAAAASVGKPAIYRRFQDKAELVATVIANQLPQLAPPDLGDTRAELWQAVEQGFPADGAAYVGLIGGLIAEQERHPELIDAFRRSVLLPRRAVGRALIERGQRRGEIRRDIHAEAALDLFVGPFLARVFAGLDTGPDWRKRAFATWWDLVKERKTQ
jgi:AcrR family transcriptional regulator